MADPTNIVAEYEMRGKGGIFRLDLTGPAMARGVSPFGANLRMFMPETVSDEPGGDPAGGLVGRVRLLAPEKGKLQRYKRLPGAKVLPFTKNPSMYPERFKRTDERTGATEQWVSETDFLPEDGLIRLVGRGQRDAKVIIITTGFRGGFAQDDMMIARSNGVSIAHGAVVEDEDTKLRLSVATKALILSKLAAEVQRQGGVDLRFDDENEEEDSPHIRAGKATVIPGLDDVMLSENGDVPVSMTRAVRVGFSREDSGASLIAQWGRLHRLSILEGHRLILQDVTDAPRLQRRFERCAGDQGLPWCVVNRLSA